MKNKVVNSTIGTISKDLKLSMKTISEVSNTVTTMKAASDAISNTVATFLAFEELTNPLHQICKFNDYISIIKIPDLYIPKISRIVETINSFQNNIKKICTSMDEISSILAEYNYLLPLTLPLGVYSDLLEYLNNTKESANREKEIDNLLLKLFSYKKWEMASEIVSKLNNNDKINTKRIVILEDCIKVLKRNSRKTAANTILPVLIAQIDGIWVDILGSKDKDKLKNTIKNMKNDKYANPARELLVDILFQYTRTAIPVKSDFCRNKILHGEEVEYGSINNVIRAFLIIEFLDSIKTDDEVNEKITV